MIGDIPDGGLNHKCQKTADAGDDADLGQRQPEMIDESRHQRVEKRAVKITGKMHQREGENHFLVAVIGEGAVHGAANEIYQFPQTMTL
jgi:H2-forming N5,N10-methylenetetrahydromethanopterin dehydrogenase-like enzyme